MVSLIDSEAKGSMRDFVLVKLTDEEFDDFSSRHPQGNFQQTSAMGRLRAAQGIDVEYLALKEGEKIVAAALFETPRSRCIDLLHGCAETPCQGKGCFTAGNHP